MKRTSQHKRFQRWLPLLAIVLASPFLIFSRGCGSEISWCNASYINYVICMEALKATQPQANPVSTCPAGCISGQCLTPSLYGPGNSCVTAASQSGGSCSYCAGYFGAQITPTPATSTVNIASIPTVLTVNEQFDIVFTTGVVPGSLVLSGTLGNAASGVHVFSEQTVFNDTVHILPSSSWPSGSVQSLTITAENDLGVTFTETVNINVVAPPAPPAPEPEPIPWWIICFFTKAC